MDKWHRVKKKDSSRITFIKFSIRKTSMRYSIHIYQGFGNGLLPSAWIKDIKYKSTEESAKKYIDILKTYWGIDDGNIDNLG